MAIRSAWFMRSDGDQQQPRLLKTQPLGVDRWQDWPMNAPDTGLDLVVPVEKYLNGLDDAGCHIDYYTSANGDPKRPRWNLQDHITTSDALEDRLKNSTSAGCHLYVARVLTKPTAQMLGHCLELSPRVFRPMQQVVTSGNVTERSVFFGLEFMELYPANIKEPPRQASQTLSESTIRFQTGTGPSEHIWYVSRIVLAYTRTDDLARFNGVCLIDPADIAIQEGLSKLMLRVEDRSPGIDPTHVAMGEVISEIFYILSFTWRTLLDHAAVHLQALSKQCMDPKLSFDQQLDIMRNLHGMRSAWTQMKRRIIGAKDVCEQMLVHPFFSSIGATVTFESYVKKIIGQLDEHLARIPELQEETSILVSLIFNIATLHDTKSAMNESKVANEIATITQRISSVAFIYLPLGLSASLFGMNVAEINGGPPVWIFGLVTSILVVSTVLIWAVHRPVLRFVDATSTWRPWRTNRLTGKLSRVA